jgi:hypothetical protein
MAEEREMSMLIVRVEEGELRIGSRLRIELGIPIAR